MNYGTPDTVPFCACRTRGETAPMLCPTGHLLECHFPLECRQAACSHMPVYNPENARLMLQMEKKAQEILAQKADPECQYCAGSGTVTVSRTVDIPDPETGSQIPRNITDAAICGCVSAPVKR